MVKKTVSVKMVLMMTVIMLNAQNVMKHVILVLEHQIIVLFVLET